MISWSNNKIKFTSGIGALCTAGLLADVSRKAFPAWIAVAIALLPVIIFLFIQPGEVRRSIVLPFQVFASLWYLLLPLILSILFFVQGKMTTGWPVYFVGLIIGGIPCIIVLRDCLWKQNDLN